MKHCGPEPGIERDLERTHHGLLESEVEATLCCAQREWPGWAHQREGIDGLEHGALAGHHAPVAQQHQKAGQAVKQRGECRRWFLETQKARKWPLEKKE